MKAGDLVKTTGFGPKGSVGEVGIIVEQHNALPTTWKVLFGQVWHWTVQDGLELLNESR
jgi:hypothetical protein